LPRLFHLDPTTGGRAGICAVFLFAATGHFFKTSQMIEMLPPFVPVRRALIYITGFLEIALGIALLAMADPFYVGLVIVAYLIVIVPSNIYAAIRRVPFGAHSMGPKYLLARLPLQLLLIWWT